MARLKTGRSSGRNFSGAGERTEALERRNRRRARRCLGLRISRIGFLTARTVSLGTVTLTAPDLPQMLGHSQ